LPGRVRRSTAAGYGIHVHRYLIPHLGRCPLASLRAGHIEAMFTAIAAQRTKSGTLMAAVTLQRIRATLRRALNMAIREGLLQVNPARLVLLPHPNGTGRNPGPRPGSPPGTTMGSDRSSRCGHRRNWPAS
jgi:hypothetical protein